MHVILTGATGLVGASVLHHILSLPPTSAAAQKISRLSILSRRPDIPLLNHPECPKTNTLTKVDVITHKDFSKYDSELLDKLRSVDGKEAVGVIWALGISQREVKTNEEYDQITRVYAVEAAKAFSTALVNSNSPSGEVEQSSTAKVESKPRVNFVYVSGEGATTNPSFMTPLFGRVKGKTELELLQLAKTLPYSNALRVYSARPGGVDPGAEASQKAVWDVAQRRGVRTGWSSRALEATILPVMRAGVGKGMHSPTGELGRVLTDLVLGDMDQGIPEAPGAEQEGRILPNIALRWLGAGKQ